MPDEPPDDAFAATVAPSLGLASPGADSTNAKTREVKRRLSELEADATMAAPLSSATSGAGELEPQLPTVDDAHYKTDKEIARGGMGKIVAAEDRRLGRPVALKVLLEPAGDALGRFQREALITARLQHPGIVPVYEAGKWPSGEPFFAMKLVSGRPLDRVIGETRTLADRLALLPRIAAAADAIAYAHSHRIVHRDLKPGNVLIGDFGETVVIDWGLAKDLDAADSPESENRVARAAEPRAQAPTRDLLVDDPPHRKTAQRRANDRSTLTIAGAVMGTPAYMAPEQARGEPVDQRADVFALGAMLYHLLAGVPPYNARTATEVIAAAALGKVVPLVEREEGTPADLAAIVDRAMAQIPEQRYPNAGALADELRRFLTGQLVSAHRYTAMQRLARWIKKHRAAVTIGAVSIVVMIVAGTFAIRQIIRERDIAQHERTLSDTRRQAAEILIDKMLSDVRARLAQIGRLDLMAALGSQIREYYATLATIPGGMPSADVSRMAVAVELIGRAERDSGKTDQALRTWTDVRDQVAALVGGDSSLDSAPARAMLARLDFQIGTIHQGRGKAAAAVAAYEKAAGEFDAILAQVPNLRSALLHAGENRDRLGDIARNDGKLDRALEEYTRGKELRQRAMTAAAADNPSPFSIGDEVLAVSTSHLKLGSVHQGRGETKTALADYTKALQLRETLLEAEPESIELQERVVEVQNQIADLQRQIGDAASAIKAYELARPIVEALLRKDQTNTGWKRLYGNLLADLGFTLLDAGSFQSGLAELDHAIAVQNELVDRDPRNTTWQNDLSRSYTRAGDAALYLGNLDDSISRYELGREIRSGLEALNATNVPYRRSLAFSHAKLGKVYFEKGDLAGAITEHEQALAIRKGLVDEAPQQTAFRNELALTQIELGQLSAARDPKAGVELVTTGIATARTLVAADPINHEWAETLTRGLIARAEVAKLANDRAIRKTSLEEALAIANPATAAAPQNAQWPVLLAEIHAGLAELDPATAATEWKAVRDLLEPLAKAGRLYAQRKPLLARAKAAR